MTTPRVPWNEYWLGIASQVSTRSTCPRLQVGAVLVCDNKIVACGYNGSRSGEKHCSEAGCLIKNESCVRAIHAESNLISQSKGLLKEDHLYDVFLTHTPCPRCLNDLFLHFGDKLFSITWKESYRQDDEIISSICGRNYRFQPKDNFIHRWFI